MSFLRQLRAALDDKASLSVVTTAVDEFVQANNDGLPVELEDELITIHREVGHELTPRQTEIFLAVLYHLRTILSPISIIISWFDLVLRPALREPRLPLVALHEASDLVVLALEIDTDDEEVHAKVSAFRRQLVHLYLLDAFNEGSGDDVITRAELDELSREKKERWKLNLEGILLKHGIHQPGVLMAELHSHFKIPSSRLQIFSLLNSFTSLSDFRPSALTLATHSLMSQLLFSLLVDNSSTMCSIGMTLLVKLLPLFAVHASANLKEILPQLLLILARVLCWKERPTVETERDLLDPLSAIPPLELNTDVEWERLEATFYATAATPPDPHRFFTFLYYLFPCNVLRFLRTPHLYLTEYEYPSPFTQEWNNVINPKELKSKAENLIRAHQCHPLIIWRDAEEELSHSNFWAKYDVARISSEATLLDSVNMALAIRARHADTQSKPDQDIASNPDDEGSSTTGSIFIPPSVPKISLQDMVATSVALKSNLNVEIENTTSQWPSTLFGYSLKDNPSVSRPASALGAASIASSSASSSRHSSNDELPSHVTRAIASLQREVVLLRNELNFELWLSRENVQHVGRLYQERSLSNNAEVERQGLYNKLRNYRAQVQSLEKELREHKEQASSAKNKYAEWNTELQSKLTKLRKDKEQWTKDTAFLRSESKEAKALFESQGILLSEANAKVFNLETAMKETQPKLDRLGDYEHQIQQHLKIQQLWETDWKQFEQQKAEMADMVAYMKQLEIRLESYGLCQSDMEEENRAHRRKIKSLEAQLEHLQRRPASSDESVMLDTVLADKAALLKSNTELRQKNEEQTEIVEELTMMVETLKSSVRREDVD